MRPLHQRWRSVTAARLAVCSIFMCIHAGGVSGQTIRGRVLDDASGAAIRNAAVYLLNRTDRIVASTLTDSGGTFVLNAREAGAYRLRGQRVGYTETTSAPVTLTADHVMEVEFRLSAKPLLLPPLTILAARAPSVSERLAKHGYYERKEIYGKMGFAHFLEQDDLHDRGPTVSSVLRMLRGVHVDNQGGRDIQINGRGCTLNLYIDGVRFGGLGAGNASLLESIPLSTIAAMEIYPSRMGDPSCQIKIWTGPNR